MAPRKMRQQASEPRTATPKNLRAMRFQVKRVKAEMGKVREDQECIREEQIKIRGQFDEIERQCDQLKEETEMIMKQNARTHVKLVLMFNILKAREAGNSVGAATLTHFLRELVFMERAANASSDDEVAEDDDP
ncbi:hypothetical protein COLO4_23522 [Corchorus olitorius]|uniref:Uncharacterized protein n=1 Tax=Corchorus olitorius TaxID=93759 RepID=A0A1R3IGB0_9ROSI|nr:hypothetical protein COLO4_23522 [Corchorus olitorius]